MVVLWEWHIEWHNCCLCGGSVVATRESVLASQAKLQCVTGGFGGCKGPECVKRRGTAGDVAAD